MKLLQWLPSLVLAAVLGGCNGDSVQDDKGTVVDQGRQFIDYLLSSAVEEALAACEAAQMPLRPGVPVPAGFVRLEDIKSMPVNYEDLGPRLETLSSGYLKEWADRNANP